MNYIKPEHKQITCPTCTGLTQMFREYCQECNGSGYVEVPDDSDCKCEDNIEYEPMVHGWICLDCGASGPIENES